MSDTLRAGAATSCPRCQTSLTGLLGNRWCERCRSTPRARREIGALG
ncbi:MAG: hypothetical protein ACRDT2_00845 [Natronosporangium sp.]